MTNHSAKRDPHAAASESFVAHIGRIGDALEEVEHQLELLKRTLRKCHEVGVTKGRTFGHDVTPEPGARSDR